MTDVLSWRQIHWSRPIDLDQPIGAIRALAADQYSPVIFLEARADKTGVVYMLGTLAVALAGVERRLTSAIPDVQLTDLPKIQVRHPVDVARRIRLSTRHRALGSDSPELTVQQLLGALTATVGSERLVLQLVLGPRRIPLAVSNQSPSSVVQPWYAIAWNGNGGTIDPEKRTALRDKVGGHGFAATVRIGASASSPDRRQALILGVHSAIRTAEAPGLQARLVHDSVSRLNTPTVPWRWPLRLNVNEAVTLSAWPIGDTDLPGMPPLHPKQVAPAQLAVAGDRIIGKPLAPGITGLLGYSVTDSARHSWFLGPTGTGKSTAMLNLICEDLEARRPVVVVEPNDLVTDLLARIPASRRDDIVVLDCTDQSPVGINPLARHGRSPELVADGLLGTFQALYGDGSAGSLGPRSTDILANCLNVLARHGDDGDASLVMLPLLLTNTGFRRSLTKDVIRQDPIAAGPFWQWFDSLSDDARSQVIAPLSNKLRPLLRPHLRAVLGQRKPKFNIRDVVLGDANHPRVLLVPLQKGVVGPETAELLGALVLSDLWLALRERRALAETDRVPLMIYVDEVQDYLRISDLADALATSRSLKASWHLAHQYCGQLPATMRAAFESNARSRIAFQLGTTDARSMAAGQSVVSAEDFSNLPAFHIYASLMRGNAVQPWASGVTLPPPKPTSDPADIRARSRRRYGRSLTDIEVDFASLLTTTASNAAAATDASNPSPGRRRRTP